jgi:CheY-like chemotaxis protein
VEDNDDNRVVYRTMLAHFGFAWWRRRRARGAPVGARRPPDLILMDISIPVMDGWETTRTLKADPDTARIPVIAVTAHALESDRARAAQIGFNLFLTKPVSRAAWSPRSAASWPGRDG